jgi:cell division septation protein DedD
MAAEQGLPAAQMRLGEQYQAGKGVPQDSQEAYFWFALATASFGVGEQRDQASSRQEDVSADLTRAQITQALDRALDWKPQAGGINESQAGNLIAELEQKITETVDEVEPHDQDLDLAAVVAQESEPTDTDSEEMILEPAAGTETIGSPILETAATSEIPERESFAVHLASLRTQDRAKAEWHRLQSEFPEFLRQRDLVIRFVDLEGRGIFYRVLTGPFHDRRKAQDFCAEMESHQQYCLVMRLADDRTD